MVEGKKETSKLAKLAAKMILPAAIAAFGLSGGCEVYAPGPYAPPQYHSPPVFMAPGPHYDHPYFDHPGPHYRPGPNFNHRR